MRIYIRVGRDARIIGETGKGKICFLEGKWYAPQSFRAWEHKFLGSIEVDLIEDRPRSCMVTVRNQAELAARISDAEKEASVIVKEKHRIAAEKAAKDTADEIKHQQWLAQIAADASAREDRMVVWRAAHPVIETEQVIMVPAELKESTLTHDWYVSKCYPEIAYRYASNYKDADRLNRVRVVWDFQAESDWSDEDYWTYFEPETVLVIKNELLESYEAATK